MSSIQLAKGLSFPAEQFACEVTAAIGNRGGGKSNGCAVAVEQLLDAGVQTVIMDYVGIWFSLRLKPDGKTPSRYSIPILGGKHGDIELSPAAGAVVAEVLAERRSSAILDLSLFSKSDRMRFVTDFAEAFFRAKKQHRSPCLVVLEEAQRYIPQRIFKGQERMLGAWEEIGEVGRNFGIGLFLITQRPQKVNKEILNLADNLLAFRTIGTHERLALEEWVQEKGAKGQRDIGDVLPSLPTGTCYAWSPIRRVFGTFKITLKSTYDAGATPLEVAATVATRPLDLAELEKSMGKATEAAQAGTPTALRAEVARLRSQVDALTKKAGARVVENLAPVRDLEKVVRRSVEELAALDRILGERIPLELARVRKSFEEEIGSFERVLTTTIKTRLGRVMADLEKSGFGVTKEGGTVLASRLGKGSYKITLPKEVGKSVSTSHRSEKSGLNDQLEGLPTGEYKVLVAAAQHASQGGVTRKQLTILCGYKRSSRDTFIQRLRAAELLRQDGDRLLPTDRGTRQLGDDYQDLPTGKALLDYWNQKLPEGEKRVLECAVDAYPDGVSRDKIDAVTGYKRSSRDTFIQRLRARQLVTTSNDSVRASDMLFDFPATGS